MDKNVKVLLHHLCTYGTTLVVKKNMVLSKFCLNNIPNNIYPTLTIVESLSGLDKLITSNQKIS